MNAVNEERADQPLDVYLHGERIGTIRRTARHAAMAFQYTSEYRSRPGALALGRQLPVQSAKTTPQAIVRWLEGLLPEGERRANLARQVGTHRMSLYGLIGRIGGDCAGAVQIFPAGDRPGRPRYEAVDEAVIESTFDRIRTRPIAAWERGARLSIAGAQEKLVLARRPDGGWAWPLHGAPSTHLLKPRMERFPGLVTNEHLCMTVAAQAGLPAAQTSLERFGRYETLVVERYDRTAQGARIHQEDFAQALGTVGKYQKEGGPSLRECFERSGVGGWPLWEQAMFAWLIGDEDKHAKNYSVLYERGQPPRLAPIYDAVCTLAYPELERRMAMRIGRAERVADVDERALRNEARRCGLDPGEAVERTCALARRVGNTVAALQQEGWNTRILKDTGTLARCVEVCRWVR